MRGLGLGYEDVARIVSQFSVDTPAGAVRSDGRQILLRGEGAGKPQSDFADIPIASGRGAWFASATLQHCATAFAIPIAISALTAGQVSPLKSIQVGDQKPLEVAAVVEDLFAAFEAEQPDNVEIIKLFDLTKDYRDRIQLLTENGVPRIFPDFGPSRIIPGAARRLLGGGGRFPCADLRPIGVSVFGVTINMLSLFAFILVLGVVVDDAIIVGEAIYSRIEAGVSPAQAAAEGAQRMLAPVLLAVATNIIALRRFCSRLATLASFWSTFPWSRRSSLSFH